MQPYQGQHRARTIWDETRKPNAPKSALIRAILYELQPIRFSKLSSSSIGVTIKKAPNETRAFLTTTFPSIIKSCFIFLRKRSLCQWGYLFALIIYWQTVVYLHELLHAGPIILIITALVMIFTIGLNDNTASKDDGYVSAYSVFNRGFQSILGSIDAENLLAQHVGGGAAAAMVMQNNNHDHGNDENIIDQNDENDGRDRGQQQNQGARQGQDNNNRSRKSGKKARRKRNVEQKRGQQREIQLQRDAAVAMGFGQDEMDVIAMNRLIEEQAAEAARRNNDNLDVFRDEI